MPANIPRPPGAGLTKVADPRKVVLGWLAFLLVAGALGAIFWQHGVGAGLDHMRRQFVAIGYLDQARDEVESQPVHRDVALRALDRAMALDAGQPEIADQAAELYIGLRAYSEAIPWLRQQAGKSLLAKLNLGQALLMTGQRAEGEALFDAVLTSAYAARQARQMPDELYAHILNNIGYVNTVVGIELPQSRSLIELAVSLEPDEAIYIDSLGWAEGRAISRLPRSTSSAPCAWISPTKARKHTTTWGWPRRGWAAGTRRGSPCCAAWNSTAATRKPGRN